MRRVPVMMALLALGLLAAWDTGAETLHVSSSGAHIAPYDSWSTAATTIQAAVDAAMDGDLVLVTNGVYTTGVRVLPGYTCGNRVLVTNDITIRSVNGPDVTVIEGSPASNGGCGTNAVRGVYLAHGLLSGFTIRNGYTCPRDSGYTSRDTSGGGVHIWPEGVIEHCIVTGNRACSGAGVRGGETIDSVISHNTVVSGMGAYDAGGVYEGVVRDSVIKHNVGACAVFVGPVINCLIVSNRGSGIRGYFVLNPDVTNAVNCVISHNYAGYWHGGGVNTCTIYNSLIVRNIAEQYGGGAYQSILKNCTVVDNELWAQPASMRKGTGLFRGSLYNSIVGRGMTGDGIEELGEAVHSCHAWIPEGNGNIREHPRFIDHNNGDYRLAHGSPCIDRGVSLAQVTNDLAGRARPVDGDGNGSALPDIGCYEYDAAAYDSDKDGHSDAEEAVAATNPTNAHDRFSLDPEAGGETLTLTFRCSPARLYTVQSKESLMDGEWTDVPGCSDFAGDAAGTMAVTVGVTGVRQVFRIEVREP